jgi:hypothetical protein
MAAAVVQLAMTLPAFLCCGPNPTADACSAYVEAIRVCVGDRVAAHAVQAFASVPAAQKASVQEKCKQQSQRLRIQCGLK